MNGAESLLRTLVGAGVDTVFANPGTSELHLVGALDRVPEMRPVLALFEGVVTGAADGYARVRGTPAATLLHLGPGLANGLANLHNARRAASPVVNIVGEHASGHAKYDGVLNSDIEAFAGPVSSWIRTVAGADSVGPDAAEAVQAATSPPGQIATLILPADVAWSESDGPAPALPPQRATPPADSAVAEVERILRSGARTALLLRGEVLKAGPLLAAGRIAARSGCRLFCDTFAPRLERGAGIVAVERVPYFAEQMVRFLQDLDCLILVGAKVPASTFAYPEKSAWCLPEACRIVELAGSTEDGVMALDALADRLKADLPPVLAELRLPPAPDGTAALTADVVGQCVARHLPEGSILSVDAGTSGGPVLAALGESRPHISLALTGGAIGQGLPVSIGAAIAAPDRKVVCLLGDGSGLYTPQGLWTIARERLDVTTIVFTNRSYRILGIELGRLGLDVPGSSARRMLSLADPEISWRGLGASFGVESHEARTAGELSALLEDAMQVQGPRLIEAHIV